MSKFTFVDPPPSKPVAMHPLILVMKDGKPMHTWVEALTTWRESLENSNWCTAQIGGKDFTLGESVDSVTHKVMEAMQ